MAQAKYTILIPTHDNLGNELQDIATAAHHWLFYNGKIKGSFIEPSVRGNWRDNPQEQFERLVTYADENPEMDSTIKQLAAYIADVANQWEIFVTKEGGKSGVQSWGIPNKNYQEDQPAWAANNTAGDMNPIMAALFGSRGPIQTTFESEEFRNKIRGIDV